MRAAEWPLACGVACLPVMWPACSDPGLNLRLCPSLLLSSWQSAGHVITITLHSSHAFSCKHPFYVLSAPSQEVQMAWVNALWQVRGEAS